MNETHNTHSVLIGYLLWIFGFSASWHGGGTGNPMRPVPVIGRSLPPPV
jgi:hypothetical protein